MFCGPHRCKSMNWMNWWNHVLKISHMIIWVAFGVSSMVLLLNFSHRTWQFIFCH
jgi:hypothetical protein